jgi:hypothetical protein
LKTHFIFIVGVSRSGTTLMRTTLNSSTQIAICDENHFLGHLIASEGVRHKFRKMGDLSVDANVRRLVDYLYSGGLRTDSRLRGESFQWRWTVKRIERERLERKILESDRSERALFTIMMEVFAEYKGKPIMGEKTPAHVRYMPTLMDWFPDGRAIHMLRDPRAVFVSELARRKKLAVTFPYKQLSRVGFLFKLFVILQTMLAWRESVTLLARYQALYPERYYLQKFEDLVTDPDREIRRLCDFLGVEFQAPMLDQIGVSKGFTAGQVGFDAHAAHRWKDHIDPRVDRWFTFWMGGHLRQFGYGDTPAGAALVKSGFAKRA